MPKLTPIDFDPFAQQPGSKLVPVDFDPFAQQPTIPTKTEAPLKMEMQPPEQVTGAASQAIDGIRQPIISGARKVGEFLGMDKITDPFMRRLAYSMAETPAAREAIGRPTTGEYVGAGLQAGALALPYGRIAKAVGGGLKGAAAAGATGGYMTEAGTEIQKGEAPIPGLTTVLSAAIPTAITGIGQLKDVAKRAIPPLSKGAVEKEVGRQLVAKLDTGEMIYAKNLDEAKNLQAKFPGLKFTMAQATGMPTAKASEKGLIASTETGKIAADLQKVQADEAIQARLAKTFKGQENIDDLLDVVSAKESALTREAAVSDISSRRRLTEMQEGRLTPEEAGQTLLDRARAIKAVDKAKFDERFNALDPTFVAPSTPLENKLASVSKQFTQKIPPDIKVMVDDAINQSKETYPAWTAAEQYKTANKISYGDLRKLRSRVSQEMRFAGTPEKAELATVLGQIRDGIDETLNQFAKKSIAGEQAGLYAKTIADYKTQYVPKYRQGATSKILSWTRTGDQKVDDAILAGEYFKSGNNGIRAARDFKQTFGSDELANKAIKDYAINDLLTAATDESGNILDNKILSWIHKNRPAIQEHGLWNEFRDLRKTRAALDKARESLADFNKGYASKMLGVDSHKAIESILGRGKKDAIQGTQEIMKVINNLKATDPDKAQKALIGIQNATKDYILSQAKTTLSDSGGNMVLSGGNMSRLMDKLDPALRVIYRQNPSKLTALRETRQVLDTMRRASENILRGSSETAMISAEILPRLRGMLRTGRAGAVLDVVTQALTKNSKEKVNDMLVQAYFNPDFAETLMMAAKKQIAPSDFIRRMSIKGIPITAASVSAFSNNSTK